MKQQWRSAVTRWNNKNPITNCFYNDLLVLLTFVFQGNHIFQFLRGGPGVVATLGWRVGRASKKENFIKKPINNNCHRENFLLLARVYTYFFIYFYSIYTLATAPRIRRSILNAGSREFSPALNYYLTQFSLSRSRISNAHCAKTD